MWILLWFNMKTTVYKHTRKIALPFSIEILKYLSNDDNNWRPLLRIGFLMWELQLIFKGTHKYDRPNSGYEL